MIVTMCQHNLMFTALNLVTIETKTRTLVRARIKSAFHVSYKCSLKSKPILRGQLGRVEKTERGKEENRGRTDMW